MTKRTKRYKKRRHKKRYTRRHRGGSATCYGSGVGSNNFDPSLSVYNTNLLKLFPYKP